MRRAGGMGQGGSGGIKISLAGLRRGCLLARRRDASRSRRLRVRRHCWRRWPRRGPAASSAVRYRGFVLLPQPDLGWLVRPERSPMTVLPFRTPPISLCDVKALVDWRLDQATLRVRPRR